MCGLYFNKSAAAKVSEYHVHIYFSEDGADRWMAEMLANRLVQAFPGKVTGGHAVGKVGPHTRPNIEVDIAPEAFGEVLKTLQLNSQGLSILVHPRTGDEVFDHLSAALWLGQPVPFNEAFFDRLMNRAANGPKPPRR
jgi:DOPA 4,5-dioxygenase